jgi:hypothetical protein
VSATALSEFYVRVTWGPAYDPEVPGQQWTRLEGYNVLRDGQLIHTEFAPPTALEYLDNRVAAGTRYRYTVVAFDQGGNVSAPAVAEVTTPGVAPPPPPPPGVPANPEFTGLAAGCVGVSAFCPHYGDIPLTWTAVPGATRYQVLYSYLDYTTLPPVPAGHVVMAETTATAFNVPASARSGFGEVYSVRACNTSCGPEAPFASFFIPFTF